MKVLVINTGSSSIKYQLFNMDTGAVMVSGLAERLGLEMGKLTHKIAPDTDRENKIVKEQPISNHKVGMELIIDLITDKEVGVIQDRSEINAVGHRVVHGGEIFQKSTLIDKTMIEAVRANIPLAPLHNPANLVGIEVAQALFDVPNVGVFDTAFHQTLPAKAYRYALPHEMYHDLRVRKYGFHGTSHKYVAKEAARFMNKPAEKLNLITVHIGNGGSISAIKGGTCVDTSMGMTPLAGIMMGTRCGDIDPALHLYLTGQKSISLKEVDTILNKESGLQGICGMSDMRDIHDAVEKGDEDAKLALDMFCYRIKQYIGSYYAILGRVDAVVFTAGIGENDIIAREQICAEMEHMGMKIDLEKNNARASENMMISTEDSPVKLMVIPTNEELQIAEETMEVING